jgi:hypothetical protein
MMGKANIELHPDWPALREDIEVNTLRTYATLLALCEEQMTSFKELGSVAKTLRCRDLERLTAHIEASAPTRCSFLRT